MVCLICDKGDDVSSNSQRVRRAAPVMSGATEHTKRHRASLPQTGLTAIFLRFYTVRGTKLAWENCKGGGKTPGSIRGRRLLACKQLAG